MGGKNGIVLTTRIKIKAPMAAPAPSWRPAWLRCEPEAPKRHAWWRGLFHMEEPNLSNKKKSNWTCWTLNGIFMGEWEFIHQKLWLNHCLIWRKGLPTHQICQNCWHKALRSGGPWTGFQLSSVIFDASSRVRAQQCSCVDIVRLTLHHVCCH